MNSLKTNQNLMSFFLFLCFSLCLPLCFSFSWFVSLCLSVFLTSKDEFLYCWGRYFFRPTPPTSSWGPKPQSRVSAVSSETWRPRDRCWTEPESFNFILRLKKLSILDNKGEHNNVLCSFLKNFKLKPFPCLSIQTWY